MTSEIRENVRELPKGLSIPSFHQNIEFSTYFTSSHVLTKTKLSRSREKNSK
jgi:hypothetical protein